MSASAAATPEPRDRLAEVVPIVAPAPVEPDVSASDRNNLVKRTVDEVYGLMAEVHEIREELLAHGVQFHMLNALIELGVNDKPDEQATLADTAVEASVKAHGSQAIRREELDAHLEAIVTLEKSLRHVRHVAAQQGLHMQAMNHLMQLMRLNPGDRGVHAINTFVAYADAAGVSLDRVRHILGTIEEEPDSVLPDIPRALPRNRGDALRELLGNVIVGLVLTVGVMWLVL